MVTCVRSVLQQLSQLVSLLVIVMLPLGTMQIVQNTQAFWTTVFGYLINQENFLKIELIGILACFCGVIMMASPSTQDISIVNGSQDFWKTIGLIGIVITAGCDGLSSVLVRQMQDVHFSKLLFWFSLVGVIGTTILTTIQSIASKEAPTIFSYDATQMTSLLVSGLLAGFNTTCLTIAFQNEKSTTVSLLAYIELVYCFLADVFLFNATFSTIELAGALVITSFNLLTIVQRSNSTTKK